MILADKIIHLRKRYNMTQEDLAEKLNVSRQSVSKWEGNQATPDLNKVLKLSKLFGVTTDYLLNDDDESLETEEEVAAEPELPKADYVSVSLNTAKEYLEEKSDFAHRIGIGVVLLISSVIPIVTLTTPSMLRIIPENVSEAIGISALFLLVALGVGVMIFASMRMQNFAFLEEAFELEFGVRGFVEKEIDNYRPIHTRQLSFGVALIIVSVLPIIIINLLFPSFAEDHIGYVVGIFFAVVSMAIYMLISTGIYWGSLNTLLNHRQPEDEESEVVERLAGIYWPLVTAIFLGYSFITADWGRSWFIWPIAAMIFAALSGVVDFRNQKNE